MSAALARPIARPRPRTSPRIGTWILPVYTGLAVAYLFIPIVVMIAFGFNDPKGHFNYTWQGFTLSNYAELFAVPGLADALITSLIVAVIATLASTVLGTCIALALTRHTFRGRSPLNVLIFLPIATPEVVLGASLLALFVSAGISRDITTIIIAHIMFDISYVVITVRARIAGFDQQLEEAAMDLGANEWTTFRKVTFPLIFPGIMAASLLAFALSIDDFVITLFTSGRTSTFPLWVYGASRIGIPPQVNVMGTLIFATALVCIVGWLLLQRGNLGTSRTEP